MRAVVDAISALSPWASFGFLTRGIYRWSAPVGSGRSMLRFAVEVAVRGLTGTAEGADNPEETGAGGEESASFVRTAPDAWSSRTIASTIAASLVSSIKYLHHSSLLPPGGLAMTFNA